MKQLETFHRLLYRRQFLLGPEPFLPNQFWSSVQLKQELSMSIHRDLPFVSESLRNMTIILAGLVYDPFNPEYSEQDIIRSLIRNGSDIEDIIKLTKPLGGRWVIIFQNVQGTFLFTDPCGFRQIFFHYDVKNIWCASQPELINSSHKLSLSSD